MNNEKVLNRIEFYNELRDVLYDGKAQPAKGLVRIYDVLDFLVDLGLEEAILFAFEEEIDDDDSSSLEVSSLAEGCVIKWRKVVS